MNSIKKIAYFLIGYMFLIPLSAQAFSDLPEDHNHHFALTYLNQEGIIDGYEDGTVRPDDLVNRAELLKILVEGLVDSPTGNFGVDNEETFNSCFPDVEREWFAPYVCYALDQEWVAGYPDGTFKPAQNINKVEAIKIILNAFEIELGEAQEDLFLDTNSQDWYAPFLQVATDKNLLEEATGSYFNPTYFRSRGEVSEMIARIMQINYMDDPAYSDWIRAEFQTFMLINDLRAKNGIDTKLVLNPFLTKVAREHSKDMAEVIGDMSHDGSDGSLAHERIRASGIEGNTGTGENVGKGIIGNTRSIFNAISDVHTNIFMPEPDGECNHRTTILGTCLPFTNVGIGVYLKDNMMYFTQDFVFFVE